MADRIRFLDDVGDAEKPYLMAGCAAFVLPSKPRPEFVETFGIALVEKMLAGGGPVITTDTGGIGEAVGDCAIIVPVDDPDAIAAALDRVVLELSADERADVAAAGPGARAAVRPRRGLREDVRPAARGPGGAGRGPLTPAAGPPRAVGGPGRRDRHLSTGRGTGLAPGRSRPVFWTAEGSTPTRWLPSAQRLMMPARRH